MSIMTTGLSVSAGVFVPALLSGAAWGRLIGIGIQHFFPEAVSIKSLDRVFIKQINTNFQSSVMYGLVICMPKLLIFTIYLSF